MSNTLIKLKQPDGSNAIGHLWWLEDQGRLACQLVGYFLNTEAMKLCLSDEDTAPYSAKRVSILACDLAEALYAEMDMRDWILKLPPPNEQ